MAHGFEWQGEPEAYDFVFNPLEGRLVRLTIRYGADRWIEKPPWVTWLETVISLDELQWQAFTHAEAILRDFGLSGYRLSWIDGDFPITEFLRLRAFLFKLSIPTSSLAAEVEYFSSLLSDNTQGEATGEAKNNL